MALCAPLISTAPKTSYLQDFNPLKATEERRTKEKRFGASTLTILAKNETPNKKITKLVTFLGKGGSGKTTAAIFSAQHYAMLGLKTCLVVQSQDPTSEYLLNCKIGSSPVTCGDNLSAVRLETTKMILEPLKRLKQADARLNMTQGVLEGIVGEELSVLPGMDSIFSALELERITGLLNVIASSNKEKGNFDIVVYDGISTDETIRMIGATSKARLYLKYLRSLAEKTDLGRVAGPSVLRLVGDSLNLSSTNINGKMSSEIWDYLENILEKGSIVFADPQRFSCYLVMDPNNPLSINAALRYWGCAIQAGTEISGAFGISDTNFNEESAENIKTKFLPLHYSVVPHIKFDEHLKWSEIMAPDHCNDARKLLSGSTINNLTSSVQFDPSNKTVRLFMPGFDKSEIKLYQFRGRSELLVEAGDQRRVIRLPPQVQGKVGGAKFVDRSLVITIR